MSFGPDMLKKGDVQRDGITLVLDPNGITSQSGEEDLAPPAPADASGAPSAAGGPGPDTSG